MYETGVLEAATAVNAVVFRLLAQEAIVVALTALTQTVTQRLGNAVGNATVVPPEVADP